MPNPIGMILCAGLGTRLRPLTYAQAKPALEVGLRPIVFHLLDKFKRANVKDVVINLHHQAHNLRKLLEKYQGLRIHYSYEKSILGTAGAVKRAVKKFHISSPMLIVHGDTLFDFDLKRLLYHKPNDFCVLLCRKDQNIAGYKGNVKSSKNGKILELGQYYSLKGEVYQEGFFTGVQYLSKEAIEILKTTSGESLVANIYPRWLEANLGVCGFFDSFYFDDLGTPQRLFEANMRSIVPNKTLLGKNLEIHSTAKIGANVILGNNVKVKEYAAIENSVVFSGTTVYSSEELNLALAANGCRVFLG